MLVADARRLPYPDGSAHMAATSPPYYMKRRYAGVLPSEWPPVTYRPMPGLPEVFVPAVRHKPRPLLLPIEGGSVGGCRRGWDDADTIWIDDTPDAGILGLEPDPLAYIGHLVLIFRETWRVLRDDGVLCVNIGDSYANDAKWGGYSGGKHAAGMHGRTGAGRTERKPRTGYPAKCLMGIPWRLAFAMIADGWTLRSRMPGGVGDDSEAVELRPDVIWRKNAMPESVRDRPSVDFEDVLIFSKGRRYCWDQENGRTGYRPSGGAHTGGFQGQAELKPRGDNPDPAARFYGLSGANIRASWWITTEATKAEHYAAWPRELVRRLIKIGTSDKGCCSECGAQWVREVKVAKSWRDTAYDDDGRQSYGRGSGNRMARPASGGMSRSEYRPVGWRPSCDCIKRRCPDYRERTGAEWEALADRVAERLAPVPCSVLDPFSGIGRTGEVCYEEGRRYMPAEISPAYAVIQKRRLAEHLAVRSGVGLPPAKARTITGPLFDTGS